MTQMDSVKSWPTDWRKNYYWRAFATFISFLGFGLFAVLASTLALLLVAIPASTEQRQRRMRRYVHFWFKLAISSFKWLGLIRYTVNGDKNLLLQKGVIVVANHPSLIDTVFVMSFIPDINCVVNAKRRNNFFLSTMIRCAQYIPNSEDPSVLLERCSKALKNGNSLIIFPEGSRNVPGQPMRLKRGAARIALAADAPVVPVAIHCSPRTLTKGEKWYKIPRHQIEFTITIGDASALDANAPYPADLSARNLTQQMQNYFQRYVEY